MACMKVKEFLSPHRCDENEIYMLTACNWNLRDEGTRSVLPEDGIRVGL